MSTFNWTFDPPLSKFKRDSPPILPPPPQHTHAPMLKPVVVTTRRWSGARRCGLKGAAFPCYERTWMGGSVGGWLCITRQRASAGALEKEVIIYSQSVMRGVKDRSVPTCLRQAASHSSDTTGMPSSVARCVSIHVIVCAQEGWSKNKIVMWIVSLSGIGSDHTVAQHSHTHRNSTHRVLVRGDLGADEAGRARVENVGELAPAPAHLRADLRLLGC